MTVMKIASEFPPQLIKGRAIPVTGMEDVATAMLITTCTATIAVMPDAIRQLKRSGALIAILTPRQINNKYNTMIATHPKKPSS